MNRIDDLRGQATRLGRTLFTKRKEVLVFVAALSTALYCLFLLTYNSFPVINNTDSSWQYALSGLRHSSQRLGVDIVFTHGPLYEKMPIVVHANDSLWNFIFGNILFAPILIMATWAFWKCFTYIRAKLTGAAGAAVIVGIILSIALTLMDIDTGFYFVLLATFFACRIEKRYWLKIVALAALYTLAYYKFNMLVPALLVTPLIFIKELTWKDIAKGLKLSILPLLLSVVIFFLLTGCLSVLVFFRFFYWSLVNAVAYSEFMGFAYSINLSFVLTYLAIMGTLVGVYLLTAVACIRRSGLRKSSAYLIPAAAFLMVAYFEYKHAVVRNDNHVLVFGSFLFLCGLFIVVSLCLAFGAKKQSLRSVLAALAVPLSLVSFIGFLVIYEQLIMPPILSTAYTTTITRNMRLAFVDNRFNYSYFLANKKLDTENIKQRSTDIQSIRDQLNKAYPKKDLLFLGNTNLYGEALKKDHQVLYPPFLQNYAAYPPSLTDDAYIKFVDQYPDALLFIEEREASIDNRLPADDINKFFTYVLANYKVVLSDTVNRQYVLQRVSGVKESCSVAASVSGRKGELIKIPQITVTTKQYLKVKFTLKSDLVEDAVSLLVRAPVYTMTVVNPDGVPFQHRTAPGILERGVSIKPFYISFGDYYNHVDYFVADSLIVAGGMHKNAPITANFEVCSY